MALVLFARPRGQTKNFLSLCLSVDWVKIRRTIQIKSILDVNVTLRYLLDLRWIQILCNIFFHREQSTSCLSQIQNYKHFQIQDLFRSWTISRLFSSRTPLYHKPIQDKGNLASFFARWVKKQAGGWQTLRLKKLLYWCVLKKWGQRIHFLDDKLRSDHLPKGSISFKKQF